MVADRRFFVAAGGGTQGQWHAAAAGIPRELNDLVTEQNLAARRGPAATGPHTMPMAPKDPFSLNYGTPEVRVQLSKVVLRAVEALIAHARC